MFVIKGVLDGSDRDVIDLNGISFDIMGALVE